LINDGAAERALYGASCGGSFVIKLDGGGTLSILRFRIELIVLTALFAIEQLPRFLGSEGSRWA
jgi:hypothetical protein